MPVVGSGLDIYEGARDGNWVQFGIGIGGLALDVVTLGAGSVIKGGVKTIGTELIEGGLEMAAKDAAKEAAEDIAKEGAELGAKKIFRGENSLELSNADIKSAFEKGTDLSKGTRGLSLNTNPLDWFVQKYGGAWEVDLKTVPINLKIELTSGTHYEIIAPQGTTIKSYQNLLNQIQLKPYNSWPIK